MDLNVGYSQNNSSGLPVIADANVLSGLVGVGHPLSLVGDNSIIKDQGKMIRNFGWRIM